MDNLNKNSIKFNGKNFGEVMDFFDKALHVFVGSFDAQWEEFVFAIESLGVEIDISKNTSFYWSKDGQLKIMRTKYDEVTKSGGNLHIMVPKEIPRAGS